MRSLKLAGPLALALAVSLTLLGAAPTPAAPPDPAKPDQAKAAAGEPFAESIDVRVVNVEVFVADRSGRPVTGLTRDDFELSEDGRPVPITNFYAQAAPAAAGAAPGVAGSVGPAAGTPKAALETPAAMARVPESQRLDLGIFIDNLELTPAARNRVLFAIKDFVAKHVTAGDRV